MAANLTSNARKLLHALIHSCTYAWWEVVEDKKSRNAALTELINLGLVELHPLGKDCRVTPRGHRSNELYLRSMD
jgi:hypothetical protein